MIAAASIDDVLAISCFTVLVGVTFNPGSDLARTALQGPLEVVAGLGYGLLLGTTASFLPPRMYAYFLDLNNDIPYCIYIIRINFIKVNFGRFV